MWHVAGARLGNTLTQPVGDELALNPQPLPPPWLEAIGHAAAAAMLGARMGGELGEQLRVAASALILESTGAPGAP